MYYTVKVYRWGSQQDTKVFLWNRSQFPPEASLLLEAKLARHIVTMKKYKQSKKMLQLKLNYIIMNIHDLIKGYIGTFPEIKRNY